MVDNADACSLARLAAFYSGTTASFDIICSLHQVRPWANNSSAFQIAPFTLVYRLVISTPVVRTHTPQRQPTSPQRLLNALSFVHCTRLEPQRRTLAAVSLRLSSSRTPHLPGTIYTRLAKARTLAPGRSSILQTLCVVPHPRTSPHTHTWQDQNCPSAPNPAPSVRIAEQSANRLSSLVRTIARPDAPQSAQTHARFTPAAALLRSSTSQQRAYSDGRRSSPVSTVRRL